MDNYNGKMIVNDIGICQRIYVEDNIFTEKQIRRQTMKWIETNKPYFIEDDRGNFIGSYKKCPVCNYDRARGGNFCCHCGADFRKETKNEQMGNISL